MRHFCFVIILLLFSYAQAQSSDNNRYELSLNKINEACLGTKQTNLEIKRDGVSFCSQYQQLTKNVTQYGDDLGQKILKAIYFENAAIFSGVLIKTIIDKKIQFDPQIKSLGSPKFEISDTGASVKFSYDFNL